MKDRMVLRYLVQHDQVDGRSVRVELEVAGVKNDELDPSEYPYGDHWASGEGEKFGD